MVEIVDSEHHPWQRQELCRALGRLGECHERIIQQSEKSEGIVMEIRSHAEGAVP
jgi:hypothetical protein